MLEATLLTDGSSDRVLQPFVEFLLEVHCKESFVVRFAEGIPPGPLNRRLKRALELFRCDIAFVHRDAEAQAAEHRVREIEDAIAASNLQLRKGSVAVVPVRMTEAWLLLDEVAIRRAAGNPNGQVVLGLPSAHRIESVDAKRTLFDALERATEFGTRRRQAFDKARARLRVGQCIDDFDVLRALPSFRHLEEQVRGVLA